MMPLQAYVTYVACVSADVFVLCTVEYIEHARRPPNHMTNRRAGVIPKTSSVDPTNYTSSVEPTSSPSSPTAQSSRFLLACMRCTMVWSVNCCATATGHVPPVWFLMIM
jgi:hypothetical protein